MDKTPGLQLQAGKVRKLLSSAQIIVEGVIIGFCVIIVVVIFGVPGVIKWTVGRVTHTWRPGQEPSNAGL